MPGADETRKVECWMTQTKNESNWRRIVKKMAYRERIRDEQYNDNNNDVNTCRKY